MTSRRADVGYGPSALDSSTRRSKQIVLWTDDIRLTARFNLPDAAGVALARQDNGGSMAFYCVDGRSFWSAHVDLRT
jgi:hypothetical protein